MENVILQEAVNRTLTMGPAVLMQGMRIRRPSDVVGAPSLSQDEKRAILAAWASDFYAVDSKPALRRLPRTNESISIDEVQAALRDLDQRGLS